jgi:hypothetical protein
MRIEAGQLNTPVIDDPALIETYKKTTPVKNGLIVIDLLKTPVPLPYNENWEEQRFTVVEPYMAEVYDSKKKIPETVADVNKKLNELSPKE